MENQKLKVVDLVWICSHPPRTAIVRMNLAVQISCVWQKQSSEEWGMAFLASLRVNIRIISPT